MKDWMTIAKWINEPFQPERLKVLGEILNGLRRDASSAGLEGARDTSAARGYSEAQKETLLILGILDPRIQDHIAQELTSPAPTLGILEPSPEFIRVSQFLLHLIANAGGAKTPALATPEELRIYFSPLLDSVPDQAACAIHPFFRTFYIHGKLSPISNSLLDILIVLREQTTLSFAEATKICFGIDPYDESVHVAKIHNLLYRLRKLIPTLEIVTKGHMIYLRSSLHDIKFLKIPHFAYELSLNKEWQIISEQAWPTLRAQPQHPGVREQQILLALMINGPQTRRELQRVTGLPKPSLLRYLNALQENQMVLIQGRAEVPVYALPTIQK